MDNCYLFRCSGRSQASVDVCDQRRVLPLQHVCQLRRDRTDDQNSGSKLPKEGQVTSGNLGKLKVGKRLLFSRVTLTIDNLNQGFSNFFGGHLTYLKKCFRLSNT
jgi:hypothetical protein